MEFSRTVIMGDPSQFSIQRGANPHTRNFWGMKKKVDLKKAVQQWHAMARTLTEFGVEVLVIPPDANLPGLVFPANAGVVLDPETPKPLSQRKYILSSLNPSRTGEQNIYAQFLKGLGLELDTLAAQFEGEADLIPWGKKEIFTYGILKKQRWFPRLGFPPWKRSYGFRSEFRALESLSKWFHAERIITLELSKEKFYHGDTVLTSFGPNREYLLVYGAGLKKESRKKLEAYREVLWISKFDAVRFAANAFQVKFRGECVLFMPRGLSRGLRVAIERKGIRTVSLEVSEFFEKGGGSVKCLLGDLGAWAPEAPEGATALAFREGRWFPRLFP